MQSTLVPWRGNCSPTDMGPRSPIMSAVAVMLWSTVVPAVLPAATVELTRDPTATEVSVSDVTLQGSLISGRLENRSGDELRDIRLLADVAFLWANETRPGDDNPGRSVTVTVPGPLPPHGSIRFDIELNPPLPERSDGRFVPTVHVMKYTVVPKAPGP